MRFLEALYQFPGTENIFKAQFSDRPLSFLAVACYASAAFLFDGIAKAHKSDHTITPESLFESLKTISSIQIGGTAIPVKDRKAQFSLGMFKIENGRKELLMEP